MAQWLLIEHGTVIDGSGSDPVADCALLIHGDRIAAVGDSVDLEAIPRGEEVERIDATGRTVMPGLIDAHCHTSFGESRSQEAQDLYTSVELRTLRSATATKRILRAGFTSISDPGGSFYIPVGLREGIREGILEGPRMFVAGRFITTSNGLGNFYPSQVGEPESMIGAVADTPDDMLAMVRTQVKNGVDLIKLGDSISGEHEAFSPDEIKLLTDTAHRLNRPLTIHARGSENVRSAVAAGVDWIMHGNVMADDVIEQLAESGIPLCPSLTMLVNYAEWGHLVGAPVATQDRWKRVLDVSSVSLHKAHEAGVRMIAGTDSGFSITPYGEWHARELRALMDYAGLSPLEAISAATANAAVTVGLEGQVGRLVAGHLADLILVTGNPLGDMAILEDRNNIVEVIKGGVRVDFSELSGGVVRRPFREALTYTQADLTYDLAHARPTDVPQTPEIAPGDLLHEMRRSVVSGREA